MKVKDAMHKGVDWVSPDTPVSELAKLMREHDIGAIPIGENDRLIGMVTDRDIVCKGLAQDSFDARRATARDVMTPGIHCCRDDDDLAKAVRHMEKLQVRRLPVINKSRRMIGILSLGDVSNSAPGDLLSELLLKLGFEVAQSTVARYMCRRFGPPSQGWRTFLSNHADRIAAIDLFVLPTVAFQILYCLVILRHGRRFWMSFGVTSNPTAEWISRQITEAFPWDHAPEYLIRDRDRSYGSVFVRRLSA